MLRQLFTSKRLKPQHIKDSAKAVVVASTGLFIPTGKSPDETLGELFDDVRSSRVFADNKAFVDLVPSSPAAEIRRLYKRERSQDGFDLKEFVDENFTTYQHPIPDGAHVKYATTREYITHLWPKLERSNRRNRGSLFALPYKYVVPGGRFQELFYWDTYFIMLGLAADHQWNLIRGMMKNYTYMIRRFGFVPTANRNYFLSRSQPPFFALMVKLLAGKYGRTRTYTEYLPYLALEYRWWMKGRRTITERMETRAVHRVVRMPNGAILNRYYDNKLTPRPEMAQDDIDNAELSPADAKEILYLDFRAAAESGWDFSSRWFANKDEIQTIHTSDIVPVDLNCLMYIQETTQAEAFRLLKQPLLANRLQKLADRRADTIRKYMWNDETGFFHDYDCVKSRRTPDLTLAGVFPLYARIATSEQAESIARMIEQKFLKQGGVMTTLLGHAQQWDAPNGWAPLQWIVIKGLREYGYHRLADEIRKRWLALNDKVYREHGVMIEKYDVVKNDIGGGGEYQVQDGFGWTNGVYAALWDETHHGK